MPFPTPTPTPNSINSYVIYIVVGVIGGAFLLAIILCYLCNKCEDQNEKLNEKTEPLEVVPGSSILPPIFYTPDADPLKQQDLKERLL